MASVSYSTRFGQLGASASASACAGAGAIAIASATDATESVSFLH